MARKTMPRSVHDESLVVKAWAMGAYIWLGLVFELRAFPLGEIWLWLIYKYMCVVRDAGGMYMRNMWKTWDTYYEATVFVLCGCCWLVSFLNLAATLCWAAVAIIRICELALQYAKTEVIYLPHGRRSIGQHCFDAVVPSHFKMQCIWKTWLHSPHTGKVNLVNIYTYRKSHSNTQGAIISRHLTARATSFVRDPTNTTHVFFSVLFSLTGFPFPISNSVPWLDSYFHR